MNISGCSAVALTGTGNARTATCSTAALVQGTRSISALYAGNTTNATSTSTNLSQVVNAAPPAPTTTAVASSLNPSTVGQSVTFTATVTGVAPTGNVAFRDGGVNISGCSAVALTGTGNARTATCSTAALVQGTRSISALYAGNTTNATSTSTNLSQVVNAAPPAPTTTAVASSLNPSIVGQSVTFTATVTGVAPTGNVAFRDGGVNISGCSAVALTGTGNARTATCATAALVQGTRSISAVYAGNASNATSTSTNLSQVVNAAGGASSNVALAANGGTASASSQLAGFAASTAIDGNPTGTWGTNGGWNDATGNAFPDWLQVTFNGQKTLDRVVVYTLQDGAPSTPPTDSTTFTLYGITAFQLQTWNGSSWVTQASVSGNNLAKRTLTFPAVTTDRIRILVTGALLSYSRITEVEAWTTGSAGPAPTTTAVASSLNPSIVGQSVTFTATVTGVAPTGNVAFRDGGANISGCSAVALTGTGNARTATCATAALVQGTRSISAVYAGNASNATSTSTNLSQVVNAAGGASSNVALAANGGTASASSQLAGFAASTAIDGNPTGTWGTNGGWNDATGNAFPDWLQVTFNGQKTLDRVVVYTLQDGAPSTPPTDSTTFTLYGITAFQLQTWNGSSWVTQASVSGNNLAKRTLTFPAVTTDRIRILVTGALLSYSRITEVEAWTTGP